MRWEKIIKNDLIEKKNVHIRACDSDAIDDGIEVELSGIDQFHPSFQIRIPSQPVFFNSNSGIETLNSNSIAILTGIAGFLIFL